MMRPTDKCRIGQASVYSSWTGQGFFRFMKKILTWLHDKFLSATDYGIARFPSALEFKIQNGAQDADHALHLLDNDLTPMNYVVELLCIKFHMKRDQAAVLMIEIDESGSAEVMRNSLVVLEEVAEHLRREAIRLDYMLDCKISKLNIQNFGEKMEIPGLGECELNEIYECYGSVPLSVPLLNGAKCRVLVGGYEEDLNKADFHEAIANFLHPGNAALEAAEPYIFKYYLDVKESIEPEYDFPTITEPSSVWQFIQFGKDAIVSRRSDDDKSIYISLECNCDWEPEHGLQIVFKNGAVINKVGPYDGHLTYSDAYADDSLENVIYR